MWFPNKSRAVEMKTGIVQMTAGEVHPDYEHTTLSLPIDFLSTYMKSSQESVNG